MIRPADLPSAPTGTSLPITVIATGILGGILGIGLALLRDRTDRRIRSRHDLVEISGRSRWSRSRSPAPGGPGACRRVVDPAGAEASAYRALRVPLWPRRGIGPRRLLIAGVAGGPAADAVGANLAVTIASSGWSTLLAWPNKTDLAEYFSVEAPPNVEVLVGERPIERLLVEPRDVHGLTLLPRSRPHGPRWRRGRDDAPPRRASPSSAPASTPRSSSARRCSTSAESIELCPLVDAVIVVFDPSNTTREQLVRTLELLSVGRHRRAGRRHVPRPNGW